MDLDTVSFRGCFLDVWILEGSLIQELDSFGFLPEMLKLSGFVSGNLIVNFFQEVGLKCLAFEWIGIREVFQEIFS
jgi:hypothetical protein